MVRTASHDDSAVTSMVRLSASGEPTASSWISGRLAVPPSAVDASAARMSAWSAGMSYPPETMARAPSASIAVAPTRMRPSLMLNGICAEATGSAPADNTGSTICFSLASSVASIASAAPAIGQPVPSFRATDVAGKPVSLADFKGKYVVLEWNNPGCPFVVRHGKEQTMKNLADQYKGKDVVWLGVITGEGAKADEAKKWSETASLSYPILMDAETKVAKSYGAKATPHMFVIDKSGKLAYSGAIDNDPEGQKAPGERTNYVAKAIDALLTGQTVATPETNAYGCGVKYK